MGKKYFYYVLILIVLLLVPIRTLCSYGEGEVSPERIVGGPCEYKLYPGHAKITSISEILQPSGSSEKKYEVKFKFSPAQEVNESFARTEGKEFLFLLKDQSYPGQVFLNKYGIKVGAILDCIMKVIVRGTCTPIMFDFPTIGRDE